MHTAGPGVGAKPPPTIAYPAMAGCAQARGTARLSAPPRCGSRRWQWRICVRAGDRRRPALASIPGLPSRSTWKGAANTNCCKSSRPPEYPAVSSPATSCDGHVQNAPLCTVSAISRRCYDGHQRLVRFGWRAGQHRADRAGRPRAWRPRATPGRGRTQARDQQIPVVRAMITMLCTWGCGRPCGPRWCSKEAATQRWGLTGENLLRPASCRNFSAA